jgi:hypothetical protein
MDDGVQRFAHVLHSCAREPGAAPLAAGGTCHEALQSVQASDVAAFRQRHPDEHARMVSNATSLLRHLHRHGRYRTLTLYLGLLLQGIDPTHHEDGTSLLDDAEAAEAHERIGAVVRQALHVRDERRRREVPAWAIVLICITGVLLAICVACVTGVAYMACA